VGQLAIAVWPLHNVAGTSRLKQEVQIEMAPGRSISRNFAMLAAFVAASLLPAETFAQEALPLYDLILRNGQLVDGLGGPSRRGDLAIVGDKIAAVGELAAASGKREIDANGLVVAPGFINILSWATESLLEDGNAQSDIRQGVTLEVFGEGSSMGPLSEAMRRELIREQADIVFEVPWTTLAEYLSHLENQGVSVNVASFVGASSVRIHEIGYADRAPTREELERMKEHVRRAMREGALGVGSALIYAPGCYAQTAELVELCRAAAEYDGIYISHLRSEGNRLLEAVEELIAIAREANIAAEIYHLKAAGQKNWHKLEDVLARIEAARAEGLGITADMYPYTAGATGLSASMPPWVQVGGFEAWRDRLRDQATRERVEREMRTPTDEWENLLLMAGSAEKCLLIGFRSRDLKHLTGKTLAEVALQRGKTPESTAIDLVIEDGSRVECVYFLMSEENVRQQIAIPWLSFGSDAAALAPEGVFLKFNVHPRAYGNFARLLGKYVRDERAISLEAAVRKLTSLPAKTLGLRRRGALLPEYFADVVVFDPVTVADRATYHEPHQYAAGMKHVFVNGTLVLSDGEHTGARPGRAIYGPGKARSEIDRHRKVVVSEEAAKIHRAALLFDGHNDLPWEMREQVGGSFDKLDIAIEQATLNTDIPKLRAGGVGAQFWSVYVPVATMKSGTAMLTTLEQIDFVKRMADRYPETFAMAYTAADVKRLRGEGKIASLMGMEGGHSIENSLANLQRLYDAGARYMTLTHGDTLDWADAATDASRHDGLSPFGEEVVREMNRLGMLVDLSHVSEATMLDALRTSVSPVIFSHSSARAIADHPRNVPDNVLRLVAKNGGVVLVNFGSMFVEPESARRMQPMFDVFRDLRKRFPNEADFNRERKAWLARNPVLPGTVHDVVDHIDHIARVAGVEHVGLGSDFDGVMMLPEQLKDVACYPIITQLLLDRGYTSTEIHAILGGNLLRVLEAAEKTAAGMKNGK